MSEPQSHWKLGLFMVIGALLTVTVLVAFGARRFTEDVRYYSYFDEAVTGLDVGSPVRFRGVTVGRVASIDVAPDHRHVGIAYDLTSSVLERLRLAADRGKHTRLSVPPDLRAQLGSSGVTGVKYVLLDFFDPVANPAPLLRFKTPERYIPGTPSTLKGIEQAVIDAVEHFPALAEDAHRVMAQLAELMSGLAAQRLPERAAHTLGEADATFALVRRKLDGVDTRGLSDDTRRTLATLDETLTRAQPVLDRLSSEGGVLASMQRASDLLGEAAGGARDYGPALADALDELRDSAAAIRELAEAVELDSDMLVKGRAEVQR